MKNRLLSALIFLSIALFYTSPVDAEDITKESGYVEFSNLDSVYGEPTVMVNLNKTMLGFVSKLNVSDPNTNEIIKKLKGVRVHVYDIAGNDKPALDLIAKVSKDIQAKNWLPIVSVNEDDEKVRIFTKITDDVMDGLVVMVVENSDEGEAVFINIVGEINPEEISKVTDSLNIDINLR